MWITITFSIIALAGFICNTSILVSVIKYRILRQKPYAILVSLAVIDLFKVVVLINIAVFAALEDDDKNDDLLEMCVGTSTLGMTLICATTFHLAAESLNRCFVITYPYQYLKSLKKKHVAIATMLLWFIPPLFTIALPAIMFSDWIGSLYFQAHMFGCVKKPTIVRIKNTTYTSNSASRMREGEDGDLVLVYHIVFFAFPLLVMLLSYSIMLKTAYKNASNMRGLRVESDTSNSAIVLESPYSVGIISMVKSSIESVIVPPNVDLPENIKHRSTSIAAKAAKELKRMVRDRKREIKASKTVLIIILTFVICNAPIFSIAWADHGNYDTESEIRQLLVGIAFLQVFIDPIVYFARLRDFRKARKKCKRYGASMVRKATRKF